MDAESLSKLLTIAKAEASEDDPQSRDVTIDRTIGMDYDAANRLYYGTPAGPITPATVGQFESALSRISGAASVPGANMGDSGRRRLGMAAADSTKLSLCINNSRYGRSETHVLSGQTDPNVINSAADLLATARARCLGGSLSSGNYVKNMANPKIDFIRVQNAQTPRLGYVLPTGPKQYIGPGVTAATAAEFFATAITFRLRGLNAGSGRTATATLQIVGQPDAVFDNGLINPAVPGGLGVPWWTNVNAYLNFLISGGGAWGFIGRANSEVDFVCTLFAHPANAWVVTAPGHNYAPRDRVRLTGCNAKGFNGTYRIASVAGDTFTLALGPPLSLPAPTTGNVYRIALASGLRLVDFYRYTSLINGPEAFPAAKVSKKNPGREISGLSFRPKKARLH